MNDNSILEKSDIYYYDSKPNKYNDDSHMYENSNNNDNNNILENSQIKNISLIHHLTEPNLNNSIYNTYDSHNNNNQNDNKENNKDYKDQDLDYLKNEKEFLITSINQNELKYNSLVKKEILKRLKEKSSN